MTVIAYNQSQDMTPYRSHAPQPIDPMAYLYNLERELENAERRTTSIINDLARRLDNLETKVSTISDSMGSVNRDLEQKVVSLAHRVDAMAGDV